MILGLKKIWVGLSFSMHGRGEVAYKIMTLTPEGKMPLGRSRRKQE
jgi:hypothetical protein